MVGDLSLRPRACSLRALAAVLGLVLLLSVSASTAADDTVEVRRTVVMASDAPAPGYPDGWTISASPGTPVRVGPMNASGEFFVFSGVAPPGWSTALRDVGWRRGTQDALEIIFESDLPLAGLSPSDTFERLEFGSITSDGEAQFNARESGSKSVILRHTPLDGFRILARKGEQAPGTPAGTTFSRFSGGPPSIALDPGVVLSQAGDTTIQAWLTGSGVSESNNIGLWFSPGTTPIDLLAREGNVPPGQAPITRFREVGPADINRRGEIAYRGAWFGFGQGNSIYSDVGGGPFRRIVSGGDAAPSQTPGAKLTVLGIIVSLSDAGRLLFSSLLADSSGDPAGEGWWAREPTGELTKIVEKGESLPGLSEDFRVFRIQEVRMSDAGKVLFTAVSIFDLELTRIQGLWEEVEHGIFEPVLLRGESVPGMPGARVERVVGISINEQGDIFFGIYIDGGRTARVDAAMFKPAGADPILMLGRGDTIEIAPGDEREVHYLRIGGAYRSTKLDFNVRGQAILSVSFTDGTSGAILAEIPAYATDSDADTVSDLLDNCPDVANPDQADADGNGVGDDCNEGEDADGDDFADGLDNCPGQANNQSDVDGDGLGDACDPFPLEPDNEKGQLAQDLVACDDSLHMCLERRFFVDSDGDGEDDGTDVCPDTAAGVETDGDGCSRPQYCGAVNKLARNERIHLCERSDWKNDETLKTQPRDCGLERRGRWFWFAKFECVAR